MMTERVMARPPRTIRLMTAFLLLGTFALGCITGAGLARWLLADEDTRRDSFSEPPGFGPLPLRELDLNEEQREKAWTIFEKHRPELDAVLRENFPRVMAINERIEQEIREFLTPEQRTHLDELKRRPPSRHLHRGRLGRDGFGPFGGPPPFAPPPPGSATPP
jgi:Spy/CpxP family protein refolding chaperone